MRTRRVARIEAFAFWGEVQAFREGKVYLAASDGRKRFSNPGAVVDAAGRH
jgi:hypothetical protein